MAVSCRLTLLTFIFCAGNILTSEGMKFLHKKYVILLTAGFDYGPLGEIKTDTSAPGISYSIRSGNEVLDIIKNSGKLMLKKKLDSKITAFLNEKEITVEATKEGTSEKASTKVIIIILPKGFGDRFIPQLEKLAAKIKEKEGHPKYEHITSRTLLRFLRRPSQAAKESSLAQLKLETKIMKIKKMIKQRFAQQFGVDVVIRSYLHLHDLISENMIEKLDLESHCHEPTVAEKCKVSKFRTFDGTCNNLRRPNLGASDRAFIRVRKAKYFDVDGLNDPIGYPNQPNAPVVPSPHTVSRDFIRDEVAASASSSTLTHAVMQFGQFIDHDLDLAVEVEFEDEESNTCLNVPCDGSPSDFVCPCYPILPESGGRCIRVTRSAAVCQKHGYPKAREQINVNTAYVDASQVYGSTKEVADRLREKTPEDRGLLRSLQGFDGELIPIDESLAAERALCINLGGCLEAGDSRSNEQQSLASFHSLFLREHNRIARALKTINSHWDGERVYQESRRIMGAVMQKITYKDWLPLIIGPNGMKRYRGYRRYVNPGISNAFATSAFRFGHSLIRPSFDILDDGFNPVDHPIELRFMFFNNTFIQRNGIKSLLLGLVGNFSEKVDRILSSGITQHLFERENAPGSNLAALNIQRSRDHGIPGYNEFRKFCGLKDAKTFEETKDEIKDPKNREILKRLYNDDPSLVELWVAGLAETPAEGASVGPTFQCLIGEQFQRTRDGDRFYYERYGIWSKNHLAELKKASLSRIYCDNLTPVSIQEDAFRAPTAKKPRINCERIPGIDLCQWKETKYYHRSPCSFHGKLVSKNGKCQCECTKPWKGKRCDLYLATRPVPWHASILNQKKGIVCSGALVSTRQVITTATCAKAITQKGRVRGYVRLGGQRSAKGARGEFAPIKIKSIRYSKKLKGIAFIQLAKSIRRTRNVDYVCVANWISTRAPSMVTTWGATRGSKQNLRVLRVDVAHPRRDGSVCRRLFKPFDTSRNVCTKPAPLPQPTTKIFSGSPLVQFYQTRPYLAGLLSDIKDDPGSPGERFGKYIATTRKLLGLPGRACRKYINRKAYYR